MDEVNDMKKIWAQLNSRISKLENDNDILLKNIKFGRFKTSQEKLKNKYRKFIMIETIMTIAVVLIFLPNPMVNERYLWPTLIYWVFFFLFEISVDFYLLIKVSSMDIYNSTVSQISSYARQCWKIHKIAIFIGLPLAIGAIILFALLMNADKFVIAGMICGGMIGLVIGLMQLYDFIRNYRQLQSQDSL